MSYKIVFLAVVVFAAQANAQIAYLKPIRERLSKAAEIGQEFIAPVYEYGQRIPPYLKGIPGKFYEGFQAASADYFQGARPQGGQYIPRPQAPLQYQQLRPLPANLEAYPEPQIPEVPQVEVPQVALPEVPVPEVAIPEVPVPEVAIPEVPVPEVAIPEVPVPEVAEVVPVELPVIA